MADPTPFAGTTIDYAGRPAATNVDRQLRRLVLWNVVCAPLMAVQLPGCLVGIYFGMQAIGVVPARPATWADFQQILGRHPVDWLPSLLWYAASGAVAAVSALCIRQRRWRWFSIVTAFLMCCAMPFGTIVGLMTGLVLLRRTSAEAYSTRSP